MKDYSSAYINEIQDAFIEHQMNRGLSEAECLDLIEEYSFQQIEKFILNKC